MTRPLRTLLNTATLASLLLCILLALLSYREGFALTWKGEAIGASRGLALWSHSDHRNRPLSLLRQPQPSAPTPIPGPHFLGFLHLSYPGFRLVGVPLWFPASLSLFALLLSLRAARHQSPPPGLCPTCHYDLRATPTRCPECGTIPSR